VRWRMFFFANYFSTELGTACGKLFRVGGLSIQDAGDSDIIPAQQ
jgi:ribosomal protein L30E